MTADTLFRLASMTKPVTSVAVLQLAEAGKLNLDDPVSKFIPEFADPRVASPGGPRPASREVTVFDLLTHTGGLTYGAAGGAETGVGPAKLSLEENAALLGGRPLAADPGTKWEYSLSTDALAPRDRGRERRAVRPLPGHARLRTAGDDRHRVRRSEP